MKGKGKKSVAVLLAATVLAVLAAPVVAEETEVVRCLSPLQEGEFEVTLSISGIRIGFIIETIPDGFTFPEHPSNYQRYVVISEQKIGFTVIDEITEIKYKVVAPSSDSGTFSGFWEDLSNKINGTVQDVDSDEEEDEEEEVEDIGTTPTPTPSSNVTRISIEAGEEASLTFEGSDLAVSKISIKVDKSVNNVEIVVQETEKPENIPDVLFGIPYSYFNITATNLTATVTVTAKIEFKVNKSWITDNNINETTIKLNRYDGNWTVLPTSKLSEDEVSFYFEAETSGFSLFAISGEKKIGLSPTLTPEFGETPTPVTTPEPEEGAPASTPTSAPHAPPAKNSTKGRDTGLTTVIAVIVASIAVVALVTFAVFRSRRKGGKEE